MSSTEQLFFSFEDNTSTVTVICGDSPLKMERALLASIEAEKKEDPLKPIVILVPSSIAARYLKKRIFSGGVQVLNLKMLLQRIAGGSLMRSGKTELPTLGDEVLLRDALDSAGGRGYQHPVAENSDLRESPGVRKLFKNLIKDLRQSGICHDKARKWNLILEEEKEKIEAIDPERLKLVFDVYETYRRNLADRYYDFEDLLEAASGEINRYREIFETDHLYVYGFYHFDYSQRHFLRRLAEKINLALFFPYVRGNVLSDSTLEFLENLPANWKNLDQGSPAGETSLSRVQQMLFTGKPSFEMIDDSLSVQILSCSSPLEEIREIARNILTGAREGVLFDDMAVLLKNPLGYGFLLYEVFQSIGIPCYYHDGISISTTPAGRGVRLFLNLISGEFSRFDVMEFLSSGCARFDNEAGETEPSPEIWDLLTREAGIQKGFEQWKRQLKQLQMKKEREAERIDPERDDVESRKRRLQDQVKDIGELLRFITSLHSDLVSFRQKSSWSQYITNLVRNMHRYIRSDTSKHNKGKNRDQEDNSHLEIIIRNLEGMKELDNISGVVTFDSFRSAVIEKMESITIAAGAFGNGCVNILNIASAAGLTFRRVFIPGMVAGQMPARQPENPLMYDHERQVINDLTGAESHILLKSELQEQDQVLFSLLVRACEERMVLTYPRMNPEARGAAVPSPYLLEVGRILAGKTMFYESLRELPQFFVVPMRIYRRIYNMEVIDESEYREDILRRSKDGDDRDPVMDLAVVNNHYRRALRRWEHLQLEPVYTRQDGRITDEVLLTWLQERSRQLFDPASASKLEQYHTCPYRFFLKRILGFEPLETPEDRTTVTAKDKGDLYHRILFDFFMRLKADGLLPLEPEKWDIYTRILDEICEFAFERLQKSGLAGNFSAWYEQEIAVRENLNEFIKREFEDTGEMKHFRGEFNPALFEHSFGLPDESGKISVTPVKIELDDAVALNFVGCIDRIDINKEGKQCLVIDYKTGTPDSMGFKEDDRLYGGKHLQLPLYLYSAQKTIDGITDLENSNALYYFITRKAGFKKVAFSGQKLNELSGQLRKLIQGVIDGVRGGMFTPYPGKTNPETMAGEHCSYCDFRNVCPDDIGAICTKKNTDPFIQSFKELKEIP